MPPVPSSPPKLVRSDAVILGRATSPDVPPMPSSPPKLVRSDAVILGRASRSPSPTSPQRSWADIAGGRDGASSAPRATSPVATRSASPIALRAAAVSTNPIDGVNIRADLFKLCKDPVLKVRHAGEPEYKKAAEYVAGRLKAAGFAPLGDPGEDGRTYLREFRWQERYGSRPISTSHNVAAVLEGTGDGPRPIVVMVAHLDNLSAREKAYYERSAGRDMSEYEGANDNTASVCAVLEAARALSKREALPCDVVVMFPSAEEDGLKGTEAFVSDPPFDLDRVRGVINLEMIGRNDTSEMLVFGGDGKNGTEKNALYQRAMRVASGEGLPAKPGYEFDEGNGWNSRSDHYVFQQAGCPAIMLHGRATPDSYHHKEDVLEELNLEKVETASRLAYEIALDLATDSAPAERRGPPKRQLNHYSGKVWPGPATRSS